MYLTNVMIVIDPKHPDGNTLQEILTALIEMGATLIDVDEHRHVIEAVIATSELPTLEAMGGVSYVRRVFTYFVPNVPVEREP